MKERIAKVFDLKWFIASIAILALAGCSMGTTAAGGQEPPDQAAKPGTVTVDVAYLNHPPMRPVLADVDKVLAKYGDQVTVRRHDFDTADGAAFAKAKSLTSHTPLAIYINGSMEVKVGSRQVKFYSFPAGAGTGMVADGQWSMDDLDAALAQATGVKP